jgi:hypothetical protein
MVVLGTILSDSYLMKTRGRSTLSLSDARKDREREEQFRIQQEMLARRKNKPKMQQYFADVEKKREGAQKEAAKTFWSKSDDSSDPLEKWKETKEKGGIKPIGYEPEPDRKSSRTGLNIIIPLNPIGMPKYDNGERFDLRLPYAEVRA